MKKKNISFVLNVLVFVLLISALVLETFEYVLKGANLTFLITRFKYFTELSNVFCGITCCVYAFYIFNSKKFKNEIPKLLKILKLLSVSGVIVTFLTVIFYLIPAMGDDWIILVTGSQFLYHIVIPLLALTTYLFFEDNSVESKYTFYNLVPIITYGAFYMSVAFTHIVNGKVPVEYDWYLFMTRGVYFGIATYVFFIIFNVVLAYLLNKVNSKINSK